MTDDEIQSARALCEAATPGPWEWDASGCRIMGAQHHPSGERCVVEGIADGGIDLWPADVAFIAAARTLVPTLLDEVERLRAMNATLATAAGELGDLNERVIARLAEVKALNAALTSEIESMRDNALERED